MIIELRSDTFETFEKRKELVTMLACIINARADFEPYCVNAGDSYYWQVHAGNDWGVGFDPEKPKQVTIRYRYQCKGNQFEEALVGWLMIKFRCTIVEKMNYD